MTLELVGKLRDENGWNKPSLSILLNTPSKVSRRPSFCFALDNCMKAAICMQAICHQLLELHGLIPVFSGNKSW